MPQNTDEYISPYSQHGKKNEQAKKIAVCIPFRVLKILTDERTRRQVNNLKHATNSELLCEAFLHAYTGQPLPKDKDLEKNKKERRSTSKKMAPIKQGNSSYLCIIMFKLIQSIACIGLNSCKLTENIVEL